MSEERKSILSSVNTWIQLLALIVLVAEAIILVAMKMTPKSSPLYNWYPVFMLFFLLLIVVAVIYDRVGNRKTGNSLILKVEEKELEVDPTKNKIVDLEKYENLTEEYTDTLLKFSFHKPALKSKVTINRVSYAEFLQKIGIATPDNVDSIIQNIPIINPFGKMIVNSINTDIQIGDKYQIDFKEDSSMSRIEKYISNVNQISIETDERPLTETEISELRNKLMYGDSDIKTINFFNGCIIQVLDKSYAKDTIIPTTLPNIFSSLQTSINEPLDSLISNDDSILWVTTNHYLNVLINGTKRDFSIYRIYQLIENDNYIYLLQLQWSPQSDEAISTWEELKKLLENFKLKKN